VRRALRAIATVTGCAIAIGCGGDPTPTVPAIANDSPEGVAMSLFALSRVPHEVDGEPAATDTVLDPARYAGDPGALFDALDTLGEIEHPRVVAAERLEGLDRWAIDLEGDLEGPGMASISVQVEPAEDGTWRVVWFAGPDVEWPGRVAPRGDGLATSEPPGSG
jgi:hypothetical protein